MARQCVEIMKILYLIHKFYPAHHGGSEKFVLHLAQQMQAQGHQVKVVAFDFDNRGLSRTKPPLAKKYQILSKLMVAILRRTGTQGLRHSLLNDKSDPIQCYEELYQGVPVIGFRSKRIAANRFHLRDPNLTVFAEALLQREAPDLLHAGYLSRNAEFIYAAQRLRIPYLITLTTFWLICPKHTLVNEKQQVCAGPRQGAGCLSACPTYSHQQITTRYADMERILDHAEAVIAPSHYLAQTFQREINHLPLTYIPYGIDCQRLPFNQRVYPTEQPLVFFFGGRLDPEKGLDVLLATMQRLASPHIRLQIYGDGKLRAHVQKAAQADARITYGGVYTHEQVGALLSQIDVVVIPSLWPENLPLIMQEAQAAGVPTLVSDVGGMTECVTDGVNGFTFRVGDGADLQRKMQMIIDQPELLNPIKQNIANPKPGQYRVTSLAETTSLYLKLYETIGHDAKSVKR